MPEGTAPPGIASMFWDIALGSWTVGYPTTHTLLLGEGSGLFVCMLFDYDGLAARIRLPTPKGNDTSGKNERGKHAVSST